jgi:hypothetical protein
MDRCSKCERLVDTDFDCGFYDFAYKVNDMGGHCEWCRDEFLEAMNDKEQSEHEKRIYG